MKVLVIVNPHAGKGKPLKMLPAIKEMSQRVDHQFSWRVTASPEEMDRLLRSAPAEGHKAVFLIGGDGRNFVEFDAEAEMFLGDKVRKIDYSCYFFIPKGTPHCPLVIKRVGKPIVFIDARVNP